MISLNKSYSQELSGEISPKNELKMIPSSKFSDMKANTPGFKQPEKLDEE